MELRDVMTRVVQVVAPGDTLEDAAFKMKQFDIGPVPVCDRDRLVGMLTDRDIVVRAISEGRDPISTTVREVMTPDVVFLYEDSDVREAAKMMSEKQIRRLVVLDRNERLAGIVSLGDIATAIDNDQMKGQVLEDISESNQPNL